jgi:hypothetical protein
MSINIALNKNAKASRYIEPYVPSKAVDGVLAPISRWVGSSPVPSYGVPSPVWLVVDLGAEFWVNRWVVKQMGSVGWTADYNLCDYKLQGCNYYEWEDDDFLHREDHWWDMDSVADNSVNHTDRTLQKPCKTRFVRIYVTKGIRCNPLLASIVDLEVYAADPTSARLTSLSLSAGTLDQAFGSTNYNYTANVEYASSSITVTATAEDSRATIKVNGTPATSGYPSGQISLEPGSDNLVTVEVTPYVGDPQNYVIRVNRDGSPYLSNLTGFEELNPKFQKDVFIYVVYVPRDISTVRVTPVAEDPKAKITVKTLNNEEVVPSGAKSSPIEITTGNNKIHIKVNSAFGPESKNYTIDVYREN